MSSTTVHVPLSEEEEHKEEHWLKELTMNLLRECVTGGVAACGATIFSNPLEVVKTRMQLQGELQSRGTYAVHYRNVFHAFYNIGKCDGILALQKGLVPGLGFQLVMNGIRLGSYQCLTTLGLTKNEDGTLSVPRCMAAAALSGCVGSFVASPFYLIKTQLQSQSTATIAVGTQHNIKSIPSAVRMIYTQNGLTGLWRGSTAAMARVTIGSSVQLSSFSKIKDTVNKKQWFKEGSLMVPITSSMCASIFVAVAMTPFDVVTTRMYNQGVDAKGKGLIYNHFGDVFVKIFQTEGVLGFFKGIGAHYFRLGPHTILSLVFWDKLRSKKQS